MMYLIKEFGDMGFIVSCILKYKSKSLHGSLWIARGQYVSIFRRHNLIAKKMGLTRTYVIWNGEDLDLHNRVPKHLYKWWIEIQKGTEYSYEEMIAIMVFLPKADFISNQLVSVDMPADRTEGQ